MEFWGVEVKGGKSVKVVPSDDEVIHLSQATLAELKNCTNPVMLYAKVGEQKLVIGVLKADTIPQLSMDLVFEKEVELSHNWKNGVVHLTGYKSLMNNDEGGFSDEEELIPLEDKQNGAIATKAKPATGKKEGKAEDESDESEDDSEDEDSSDESDTDMEKADGAKSESDDSEESDSEDLEDESPVKSAGGKKRSAADTKTPEPKKAKLVTPQKSGGKKAGPVHVDTPHPAKNAKGDKSNVKTTPKSLGQVTCGTCNRSFNTKNALDSHSKAKHST